MASFLKISVVALGLWSIREERPKTTGPDRDSEGLDREIQI